MLSATSSTRLIGLSTIWLLAVGSGFLLLGAYHARPGRPGTPPARWPAGSPIRLDPARPTLLIFLHPRCPCSRASVAELASIEARLGDRFAAHAIWYRPERPTEGWEWAKTEEALLPSARRWVDVGGRLGRQFGVETSGHVLLFEPGGGLLFDGGITPSRGHRGENRGLETLVALIEAGRGGSGRSPTFGCPLLGPAPPSRAEVAR